MNYHRKTWFYELTFRIWYFLHKLRYCVFCSDCNLDYMAYLTLWGLIYTPIPKVTADIWQLLLCYSFKFHIFNVFCRHIPNIGKRANTLKIYKSINFWFHTSSLWIITASYRFYLCINRMGTLYVKVVIVSEL